MNVHIGVGDIMEGDEKMYYLLLTRHNKIYMMLSFQT